MKSIACITLGLAAALTLAVPVAVAAQTAKPDCPMHEAHTASPADPPAAETQAHHDHAATPATIETPVHHDHGMSPYARKESPEVKALSADELKAYREGTGMGLAKPAELNHYPGPRHVLDLGADLGLTAPQRADLMAIFDRMHTAAVALGAQIVAKEKALDQAFASGLIDEEKLRDLTAQIASLQAELRAAHLKAHLETKRVLTAQQVALYDSLRGYPPPARS
jgi:Spy/CpxP family protein refolding chaperone